MFATLSALEKPARRFPLRRRAPDLNCSRVTLPNFFSFYHIQVTRRPDEPHRPPRRKGQVAEGTGAHGFLGVCSNRHATVAICGVLL